MLDVWLHRPGIMSAEGILASPALFSGSTPDRIHLALEYVMVYVPHYHGGVVCAQGAKDTQRVTHTRNTLQSRKRQLPVDSALSTSTSDKQREQHSRIRTECYPVRTSKGTTPTEQMPAPGLPLPLDCVQRHVNKMCKDQLVHHGLRDRLMHSCSLDEVRDVLVELMMKQSTSRALKRLKMNVPTG